MVMDGNAPAASNTLAVNVLGHGIGDAMHARLPNAQALDQVDGTIGKVADVGRTDIIGVALRRSHISLPPPA